LAELKERNQYVSEMLKEYAMKDPEVGYERGMEYVAFAIVDCALSGESTRYGDDTEFGGIYEVYHEESPV
jgi:hypothetical protein